MRATGTRCNKVCTAGKRCAFVDVCDLEVMRQQFSEEDRSEHEGLGTAQARFGSCGPHTRDYLVGAAQPQSFYRTPNAGLGDRAELTARSEGVQQCPWRGMAGSLYMDESRSPASQEGGRACCTVLFVLPHVSHEPSHLERLDNVQRTRKVEHTDIKFLLAAHQDLVLLI